MSDFEKMAEQVVSAAESFVTRAVAGITKRIDGLADAVSGLVVRLDGFTVPKDGAPGSSAFQIACFGGFAGSEGEWLESLRGKDGAPGESAFDLARKHGIQDGDALFGVSTEAGFLQLLRGKNGERGEKGSDGAPGRDGERGVDGAPGSAGKDGIDGTGKDGANGLNGADGVPGKDGERGADGLPGKDGAPGLSGKDGMPGKDADPIHPDTLALMVVTEVAKAVERAVAAIPKAKDGDAGRDAIQCEPLLSIDEAKSYPRGTYAAHRGGTIRSFRQTDPIGAAGPQAAGWAVMQNGVESETEETLDDGRTDKRVTRYTDGTELVRTIARAVVIDRGVYREGEPYRKGDGVTWGGSFWIAQMDTDLKPDSADGSWRLSVKKGRDLTK